MWILRLISLRLIKSSEQDMGIYFSSAGSCVNFCQFFWFSFVLLQARM